MKAFRMMVKYLNQVIALSSPSVETKCPRCGSPDMNAPKQATRLRIVDPFHIHRCNACGIHFLSFFMREIVGWIPEDEHRIPLCRRPEWTHGSALDKTDPRPPDPDNAASFQAAHCVEQTKTQKS